MRYIKIIVTLAIISLIFNTQKSLQAGDSIIIFQDNFNRADSETLGDPWTEMNEGYDYHIDPSSEPVGPAFLEVIDGSYGIHSNQHPQCGQPPVCPTRNPHPYAFAPLEQPVTGLPLIVSSTVQLHRGERIGQSMGIMNGETGFVEIPKDPPRSYFMPAQGVGIFIFRGASTVSNSRISIYQFQEGVDEVTIVAEESLPFQLQENYSYTWTLTVNEDFTVTAEIESAQGSHSISSEPLVFDYIMDRFYMTTVSPSSGKTGYSEEPFITKYDDIVVTQSSTSLCEPSNEESPAFCPPVEVVPTVLYLPYIAGCNLNDSGCLYNRDAE